MRKFHAVWTVASAALLLSAASLPAAGAPPPSDVRVINGDAEPVPVSGVVVIDSTAANPVHVRQGSPFQAFVALGLLPNECAPVTLPAGKTVVVESFSFDAQSAGPTPVVVEQIYLRLEAGSSHYRFGVGPSVAYDSDRIRGTYSFKAVVGAGPAVGLSLCRTGYSVISGFVTGYLID